SPASHGCHPCRQCRGLRSGTFRLRRPPAARCGKEAEAARSGCFMRSPPYRLRCHREVLSTVINSVSSKLKLDAKFEPCPPEAGDELFPNGIFEFNISRLLAFVHTHPERFPVELLKLADIPSYGDADLDEVAVLIADLSRPILLAEIAPGRYTVIDGHHRV